MSALPHVQWIALTIAVVSWSFCPQAYAQDSAHRDVHEISTSKTGTFFLSIEATLPAQLGLEPLGYEVYLNDERVEQEEGGDWTRNYVPFFTVERASGDSLHTMHFVMPLDVEAGDDLEIRHPPQQHIADSRLHPALQGMEASLSFDQAHQIYFTTENPEPRVTLKGTSGSDVEADLLLQHVRLADSEGRSTWNPGYRTTEVERLEQQDIASRLRGDGTAQFSVPLPTDQHRLVGLTVLVRKGDRQWAKYLGAASIVPPRPLDQYNEDGRFISSIGLDADSDGQEINAYKRFGIDWVRFGWYWDKWESTPGQVDWSASDQVMSLLRNNHMLAMHLVGPVPEWARGPGWSDSTADSLKDIPYKNRTIKTDWSPRPEMLSRFGETHRTLYQRYNDVIRASNVWNEPWEGMGITGWKSTGGHYRAIFDEIADAVHAADSTIKLVAADSGHNTQWKLVAAGMDDALDVISTHYANPYATNAFALANQHDLETWETETWRTWAGDAASVRHALVYYANGGSKVSLFNHEMFFDSRGNPTPSTVWTGAMAHMLRDLDFGTVVHPERPPFVYLFKGDERHVAAVTNSAFSGVGNPQGAFRSQFSDSPATIQLRDSENMAVYDMLANPIAPSQEGQHVEFPVSKAPRYIEFTGSYGKFVDRLSEAHYDDLRPVQITLRDITSRLGAEATLPVTLKNAHRTVLSGQVELEVEGLTLTNSQQSFELGPAAEKTIRFQIDSRSITGNQFQTIVTVDTKRGTVTLSETVHEAVIAQGTPTVDGDVSDWKNLNAVPVQMQEGGSGTQQQQAWRPWETFERESEGQAAVAFAADDDHLYMMARVQDTEKDVLPSMLSGRSLHEFQNSPAEYIYAEAGPTPGEGGDYLQLALANADRDPFHPSVEGRPPTDPMHRLGNIQRANYLYQIYPTDDGDAEVMRMRTPDFYYLHPLPIDYEWLSHRATVSGAKVEVARREGGYIYEVALPWSELQTIRHSPGQKARINLKVNGAGEAMYWSAGRSAATVSSTDFEPVFGTKWTNDTWWGFVDGSTASE